MMTPLLNTQEKSSFDQETVSATKQRRNQHLQDDSMMADIFSKAVSYLCFPFSCCSGWVKVEPNIDVIIIRNGQPTDILRKPGKYYFFSVELEVVLVSTKIWNQDIPNLVAKDQWNNPLKVDVHYSYQIVNALSAKLKIRNCHEVLRNCIKKTVLQALSQCTSHIDSAAERRLSEHIRSSLQEQMSDIGIEISSFSITMTVPLVDHHGNTTLNLIQNSMQ